MEKREGEREEPPAAGLANLLSSHWRCYRERGWKSSAADSHVISYSLSLRLLILSRPVCVCVHVENVLHRRKVDFLKSIRRRSFLDAAPRKLLKAAALQVRLAPNRNISTH